MKDLKKIMFLFFVGLFSFGLAQDFHASTTKVEYENGTLSITAKFFTTDLEKAVGTSVGSKDSFDAKAKSYAASKLTLRVNGTNVPLSYNGFQTNDKSTRIYLKAYDIKDIKDIEVKNGMLVETYSDQQNLVTFDVNGVRKSFTAKRGNESGKVSF